MEGFLQILNEVTRKSNRAKGNLINQVRRFATSVTFSGIEKKIGKKLGDFFQFCVTNSSKFARSQLRVLRLQLNVIRLQKITAT